MTEVDSMRRFLERYLDDGTDQVLCSTPMGAVTFSVTDHVIINALKLATGKQRVDIEFTYIDKNRANLSHSIHGAAGVGVLTVKIDDIITMYSVEATSANGAYIVKSIGPRAHAHQHYNIWCATQHGSSRWGLVMLIAQNHGLVNSNLLSF